MPDCASASMVGVANSAPRYDTSVAHQHPRPAPRTHHMQTVPAKVINEQEEYVRRVGACSQAGHRDEHSQHARGRHHPHRRKFQRRVSVVGLRLQRAHTSTRAHTTSHSHGVQPFGAKFSGHALLSITTGMLHRHRATNAVSNAGSCCVMFMAA